MIHLKHRSVKDQLSVAIAEHDAAAFHLLVTGHDVSWRQLLMAAQSAAGDRSWIEAAHAAAVTWSEFAAVAAPPAAECRQVEAVLSGLGEQVTWS